MLYCGMMNVKTTLHCNLHIPALGRIRLRLNFFKNKEKSMIETVETYMNITSVHI
jgi:hypothetical protein